MENLFLNREREKSGTRTGSQMSWCEILCLSYMHFCNYLCINYTLQISHFNDTLGELFINIDESEVAYSIIKTICQLFLSSIHPELC